MKNVVFTALGAILLLALAAHRRIRERRERLHSAAGAHFGHLRAHARDVLGHDHAAALKEHLAALHGGAADAPEKAAGR
jgi:hypothetical protein